MFEFLKPWDTPLIDVILYLALLATVVWSLRGWFGSKSDPKNVTVKEAAQLLRDILDNEDKPVLIENISGLTYEFRDYYFNIFDDAGEFDYFWWIQNNKTGAYSDFDDLYCFAPGINTGPEEDLTDKEISRLAVILGLRDA